LPEVDAIVRTATFIFGAGQDTSARLLAAALRIIAEDKRFSNDCAVIEC
jgi:hypothetical protein